MEVFGVVVSRSGGSRGEFGINQMWSCSVKADMVQRELYKVNLYTRTLACMHALSTQCQMLGNGKGKTSEGL